MAATLTTTAGILKAMLCFVDPKNTPKITSLDYDRNQLFINKLNDTINDKDGTERVAISFNRNETDLMVEFQEICGHIASTFNSFERILSDDM